MWNQMSAVHGPQVTPNLRPKIAGLGVFPMSEPGSPEDLRPEQMAF